MKSRTFPLHRFGSRHAVVLLLGAGAFLGLRVAAVGDGPTDSKPSIQDVAWIAGDWRAQQGDSVLQEHWDVPLGDSMMASFRWIRAGKLWLTEHITVVADDEKITYRFRHFSRVLGAWEEKHDPITFDLVSVSEGEAVFENPDAPQGRPRRIIYRRDGDTLTVRLEGRPNDKPDVFVFKRHD